MQRDVNLRLTPDRAFDEAQIRKALHISQAEKFIIIRRSIDARRRDVMVDLVCRIDPSEDSFAPAMNLKMTDSSSVQAIVVGSGPAGLFAALTLLENGIRPVVLERGKDVHERRVDIARISREDLVNPQSNYSFGEGGAGTYSDGKLFTRSKKRGDNQKVLGTFVQYGADPSILYDAHPHIGTDKLPKIVENMRNAIIAHGGEVLFQTQMVELLMEGSETTSKSCVTSSSPSGRRCVGVVAKNLISNVVAQYNGPVVLAVGNAARDTFEMLQKSGVVLQAKSLAMGVRLEHTQHLIDQIQYHNPAGRGQFLPAAEYSFAAQVNIHNMPGNQNGKVGVYSFCMCPGGFVVPAASDVDQVVVNGMSPSNRGSVWANSGMVVEFPTTVLGDEAFVNSHPLAMMNLQQSLEASTFEAAGKTQKAPAQRMVDFVENRVSSSLPKSSYAPGLTSYDMRQVLPGFAAEALAQGFKVFSSHANGFMTNEAVLIGTETRTSSPVRIQRDDETLQSVSVANLYPCGEGAGYAGGIVSAAIDGMRCAELIAGIRRT